MRVNIPPDEQFKKDIQAVKQKAEQGFISALPPPFCLTTDALNNKVKTKSNKSRLLSCCSKLAARVDSFTMSAVGVLFLDLFDKPFSFRLPIRRAFVLSLS